MIKLCFNANANALFILIMLHKPVSDVIPCEFCAKGKMYAKQSEPKILPSKQIGNN